MGAHQSQCHAQLEYLATLDHTDPVFSDRPVVESQVKLPLEVGTRLRCRWRDGSWHDARIIERRPLPDAQTESDYEYYVHYEKCESWPNSWPLHCGRQPAAGSLVVFRGCALHPSSAFVQSIAAWTSGGTWMRSTSSATRSRSLVATTAGG